MKMPRPFSKFLAVKSKIVTYGAVLLSVITGQSAAAIIEVGNPNTKDRVPFGIPPTNIPAYQDGYQQIYSSVLFPSAGWITQIGFMDAGRFVSGEVSFKFSSFGLGVTTRTPASPGTDFASAATDVGVPFANAQITSGEDFDLLITFGSPFFYDPALGNLLLDITVYNRQRLSGITTASEFRVDNSTSEMGTIYALDGSTIGVPNSGLVTRFTVNPVPEPTTFALLFFGAALCGSRRKARR